MKKQLLTAAAVLLSLCGYAQTKGTNALSLGVNMNTSKTTNNATVTPTTMKSTNSSFNLGYGYFIEDHTKIGVELSYDETRTEYSEIPGRNKVRSYGAGVNYQKYFPLISKFYAYAGGRGNYRHIDQGYDDQNVYNTDVKGNQYNLGAYGGITWFISKRWAFETELLSANATYFEYATKDDDQSNKQTSFNLTSNGLINNLGFKIYLLF